MLDQRTNRANRRENNPHLCSHKSSITISSSFFTSCSRAYIYTCPLSRNSFESLVIRFEVKMSGVIKKFFIASIFMWSAPIAILYGFNHNLFPGTITLSSYSGTLLSGFLAVLSVNVVIAFYICMAMKEPANKHEPDLAFVANAKASLRQSKPNVAEASLQSREKEE